MFASLPWSHVINSCILGATPVRFNETLQFIYLTLFLFGPLFMYVVFVNKALQSPLKPVLIKCQFICWKRVIFYEWDISVNRVTCAWYVLSSNYLRLNCQGTVHLMGYVILFWAWLKNYYRIYICRLFHFFFLGDSLLRLIT